MIHVTFQILLTKMQKLLSAAQNVDNEFFQIIFLPKNTLGTSVRKRFINLRQLKLPKNHFKTNLFWVQLKHIQSSFKFGKN